MCLALLLHSGCALDRIIYKTFSIHYTKEMKYNERPRTPYPEGNCFLQLCFLKKKSTTKLTYSLETWSLLAGHTLPPSEPFDHTF